MDIDEMVIETEKELNTLKANLELFKRMEFSPKYIKKTEKKIQKLEKQLCQFKFLEKMLKFSVEELFN